MGACCNSKEQHGKILDDADRQQEDLTGEQDKEVEERTGKPEETTEKGPDSEETRFREIAAQIVSPNETTNVL